MDSSNHADCVEPVPPEGTLARLAKFQQEGWIAPNWKPKTLRGVRVVERFWKRYCFPIKKQPIPHLKESKSPEFINWIDWILRYTEAKGKKKQTKPTIVVYWKSMCEYYAFHAKESVDKFTLSQVKRYINKRMVNDHKVSQRVKEKDTLSPEDFGILLKTHWGSDTIVHPHNHYLVALGALYIFCYITGSRPGTLLSQAGSLTKTPSIDDSTTDDHSMRDLSRENLSSHVPSTNSSNADLYGNLPEKLDLTSDLPDNLASEELETVCYGDIDLFIIRNPEEGESDVIVAIVDFRNLKGRPQGANGTKFFMHADNQLVYCPINFIVALACNDNAFELDLTPEIILNLKVPKRLHTLPIPWKEEMKSVPIFRRTHRTNLGIDIHPTLPMTYTTGNNAIRELGEKSGYKRRLTLYCFRRWVANTADKNVTDAMRNRILGQSSSAIFEKYYHDNFVNRDIQSMVLLRPTQDRLIQAAAQMNKNRDPLAPISLNDSHRREICNDKDLCRLRRERDKLSIQIKNKYRTIIKAKDTDLWQQHNRKGKEIAKTITALKRDKLWKIKDDYHNTMPSIEIQKQVERMARKKSNMIATRDGGKADAEGSDDSDDDDESDEEEYNPSIPNFRFQERSRLAEAFFGPDAETLTGAAALNRRIQVISDLASLCKLREPSTRQRPFGWKKVDIESESESASEAEGIDKMDLDETEDEPEKSIPLQVSRDQCIFCLCKKGFNDGQPFGRVDSAWRHVHSLHLINISASNPGICPHPACTAVDGFKKLDLFLGHFAKVHLYCKDVYSLRNCSRKDYAALDRGGRSLNEKELGPRGYQNVFRLDSTS